jgi:cephalosporin-C deacetylase
MSQGGGMGIWHGAWNPIVRCVVADMPFMGAIGRQLQTRVHRYPLKELQDAMAEIPIGEARVPHTVSYFDTEYHAAHCTVPTQVTVGLKDPACRPDTVRAIFDALPGVKRYKVLDWGHDWHPDMIPNTEEWLRENLR